MDVEAFWGCRVQSSEHFSMHGISSAQTCWDLDDSENDCFPCPFCYDDIEVHVLCSHLQEQHCFDVKNTVCPVCAEDLRDDMIGHFLLQHSHLMKRRKSQRAGHRSTRKDPREMNSYHGVALTENKLTAPDSLHDPLLSPFICSVSHQNTNDDQKPNDDAGARSVSPSLQGESTGSSILDESQVQDSKEQSQRTEFARQLLLSTIF